MSAYTPPLNFIMELQKLKQVFRTTKSTQDRRESSAEHSWSVAMIMLSLLPKLRKEFPDLDELKLIKMCLVHDTVEIYAGDVNAFDDKGRAEVSKHERIAIQTLADLSPEFGSEMFKLWHEFEARETIEAQLARAADLLCPMCMRVSLSDSYKPLKVTEEKLRTKKQHLVECSQVTTTLFEELVAQMRDQDLFY